MPVEKILEALFRPFLEVVSRRSGSGRDFLRLLGLCLAEPSAYLKPLVEKEFSEKTRRFHAALRRSLPALSEHEAHWRLHFVNGVFLHTVTHPDVLATTSHGRCRLTDSEATLRRIINFCAAGLRSPA